MVNSGLYTTLSLNAEQIILALEELILLLCFYNYMQINISYSYTTTMPNVTTEAKNLRRTTKCPSERTRAGLKVFSEVLSQ